MKKPYSSAKLLTVDAARYRYRKAVVDYKAAPYHDTEAAFKKVCAALANYREARARAKTSGKPRATVDTRAARNPANYVYFTHTY